MGSKPFALPSDLASAQAALLAEREALRFEREARQQAEAERDLAIAETVHAKARLSDIEAQIAHLQLLIEKLRREKHGAKRERTARLLEQMELQLEELMIKAAEDEAAAQDAAVKTQTVRSFTRKRPVRKPWPEDIERERVVIDAPTTCGHCGGERLSKLGEDITETLEEIPRRFKVIETVREKFTCRDCEAITQPPAPFHATPRGFIGANLLATIVFDKFGMHIPLNRQSTRFKCEGIDLSTSTLADQTGYVTSALQPIFEMIRCHVFAAERLHADDTRIPILAKGKCINGHVWSYVRDDRPFGGGAPPAALYYASSDWSGKHPQEHMAEYQGILQVDGYSGYNELFEPKKTTKPIPAIPAYCWSHSRRKFFELADVAKNARSKMPRPVYPLALEAVRKIDRLFEIEREINGLSAQARLAVRQEKSRPLLDELRAWLDEQRRVLSRYSPLIGPIDYLLGRWEGFARFIDDGRICISNNAAERSLRGIASGRKSWLFAGSDLGAERVAVMTTLIMTARLNDVDPKAWLADVIARIADLPVKRLPELLPWEWKRLRNENAAAQQAA
ncbi:MAG: IS66 family transposase [Pseudoxanthomonas sp.]